MTAKPTAARTFTPDGRVRTFLRVYQKDPKPVRLTARIVNNRDESVFTRSGDLLSAAFTRGSAEHSMDVPVASLPRGQYLLTIEAVAGDRRLTRDARFAGRSSGFAGSRHGRLGARQ